MFRLFKSSDFPFFLSHVLIRTVDLERVHILRFDAGGVSGM